MNEVKYDFTSENALKSADLCAFRRIRFRLVLATDGVSETVAKASSYVSSNGYSFPIYFDTTGEAADAYGVTGYPSTFFINRNGDLVESKVGMISLEELIEGIELIK